MKANMNHCLQKNLCCANWHTYSTFFQIFNGNNTGLQGKDSTIISSSENISTNINKEFIGLPNNLRETAFSQLLILKNKYLPK